MDTLFKPILQPRTNPVLNFLRKEAQFLGHEKTNYKLLDEICDYLSNFIRTPEGEKFHNDFAYLQQALDPLLAAASVGSVFEGVYSAEFDPIEKTALDKCSGALVAAREGARIYFPAVIAEDYRSLSTLFKELRSACAQAQVIIREGGMGHYNNTMLRKSPDNMTLDLLKTKIPYAGNPHQSRKEISFFQALKEMRGYMIWLCTEIRSPVQQVKAFSALDAIINSYQKLAAQNTIFAKIFGRPTKEDLRIVNEKVYISACEDVLGQEESGSKYSKLFMDIYAAFRSKKESLASITNR